MLHLPLDGIPVEKDSWKRGKGRDESHASKSAKDETYEGCTVAKWCGNNGLQHFAAVTIEYTPVAKKDAAAPRGSV